MSHSPSVRTVMRHAPLATAACAALSLLAVTRAATAQRSDSVHSVRRAFHGTGVVDVHVDKGDAAIVPSNADSIVVEWSGDNADRASASVRSDGDSAWVETTGEHRHVRYVIHLPRSSEVRVRGTAGDIRVGAFDGDEDIALRVGDLHVDVGDPASYASVQASTRIGDLNQSVFPVSARGWLGKSIAVRGSGTRALTAHVGVGDLVLVRAAAQTADARHRREILMRAPDAGS